MFGYTLLYRLEMLCFTAIAVSRRYVHAQYTDNLSHCLHNPKSSQVSRFESRVGLRLQLGALAFYALLSNPPIRVPLHAAWHELTDFVILQ